LYFGSVALLADCDLQNPRVGFTAALLFPTPTGLGDLLYLRATERDSPQPHLVLWWDARPLETPGCENEGESVHGLAPFLRDAFSVNSV
jgi:hypothetical protein